MLGIQALVEHRFPEKPVVLTVDGMIARAENRAMVDLLEIPLVPIRAVVITPETGVIMVDTQPRTGRRASEADSPQLVIDHHETGGDLMGVRFRDVRDQMGATSTMVTGYLLEQGVAVSSRLATALLYGIESETSGYPREASSLDDGALVWLFPRADKDLLARIRNPKLPQSHFATFQHALANAFLYRDVVVSWCGQVTQPDIIAELADFFIRFDQVNWALTVGLFDHQLKLSARVAHLNGHSGEILRDVVNGLGSAGGHDKAPAGRSRWPTTIPRPSTPSANPPRPTPRKALHRRAKRSPAPGSLPRHPGTLKRAARTIPVAPSRIPVTSTPRIGNVSRASLADGTIALAGGRFEGVH